MIMAFIMIPRRRLLHQDPIQDCVRELDRNLWWRKRWLERWTIGCFDAGWMGGWIIRWMDDGKMDSWMIGCWMMDGWKAGKMDRWMIGCCMDGSFDGSFDGWIVLWIRRIGRKWIVGQIINDKSWPKDDPVVPGWWTETLPGRALSSIRVEDSESNKPRFRRLQLQVGSTVSFPSKDKDRGKKRQR